MVRLQEFVSQRLERLQDLLSGLSARDRALLLGLIAALLLGVVVGLGVVLTRSLRAQRSLLEDRQTQLAQVTALTASHADNVTKIATIESQIKEHEGTDLQAFLEKAGKNAGISDRLNAVREKSTTTQGRLEDKLYNVTFSRLTLSEYSNFLYEVEAVGYPLKIRSVKVKRRAHGDEITLDVDMDISAFRVVEDASKEG
jgi:type II secretory pathway component PulM